MGLVVFLIFSTTKTAGAEVLFRGLWEIWAVSFRRLRVNLLVQRRTPWPNQLAWSFPYCRSCRDLGVSRLPQGSLSALIKVKSVRRFGHQVPETECLVQLPADLVMGETSQYKQQSRLLGRLRFVIATDILLTSKLHLSRIKTLDPASNRLSDHEQHLTSYGDFMKKHCASILLGLTSLVGLGTSAVGQKQEAIVTVPFSFMASGQTLPAGKYSISRVSEAQVGGLSIRNSESGDGVFVLVNHFDSESVAGSKVTFEQVGDVRYLHTIATADGVYAIALPRTINLVAGAKQHDGMSASGTN